MKSVVLDTDIFIDYLHGKNKNFAHLLKRAKKEKLQLFIPTAVLVEIFVGYEFLQESDYERAKKLLRKFKRIPLTEEIGLIAAKIGREEKLGFLGTVDLVVAATALMLKAEVATHNVRHFSLIPQLRIFKIL